MMESAQESGHEAKTLIEDAYRKIKQMIFEQKLVPGQRLVYKDLCNILNMSRTPIINALNRLEQDGFVASETFRGFYVRPIDIQEVWDAFGVREAFEVYAVEQASKLAKPMDMEVLEKKLRIHEQYIPTYYSRKKFLLDAQFHLQIAAMTNNRVLKWLLKKNFEHVFLRARLDNYNTERMVSSAKEHRRLFERMKKRDVIGGIEIIRNHVQNERDQVIWCLSNGESDEEKYSQL